MKNKSLERNTETKVKKTVKNAEQKAKKLEEGGVFGVFGTNSAPRDVFFGLYALQHRGQVSCGAVLSDNFRLSVARGTGLVSEVIEPSLPRLRGSMGIGHVRYGAREDADIFAQPLTSNYLKGNISISVAGKITNADALMANLEDRGAIFQCGSDAEVMAHLFAFARREAPSIEQAVLAVMGELEGAYSVLIMSSTKLMAFRDKDGLRPLCMGVRIEGKARKTDALLIGQYANGNLNESLYNNVSGVGGNNCTNYKADCNNDCNNAVSLGCATSCGKGDCGNNGSGICDGGDNDGSSSICETGNNTCGSGCGGNNCNNSDSEGYDESYHGLRHSYFFASEDTAFDAVGATRLRDIAPGELVLVSKDGCTSFDRHYVNKTAKTCIFEYMYFARPDSDMDGVNVYDVRLNAGRRLYQTSPADADVVIGVPSAGLHYAMGYSLESGIPFGDGLIRNYYLGRTSSRDEAFKQSTVNVKINVLKSAIKDKRVVLVDDSMVRGTTAKRIITQLREGGATEIHLRIACPRFSHVCPYSAGIESKLKRISIEKIRKDVGADSLAFLPVAEMNRLGAPADCCKKCFE